MARKTVILDLSGLEQFAAEIQRDLRGAGQGPVRDALRQWAARWRAFARARFDRNSKGGGNWPPLSPATIARRRRGDQVQGRARTRRTRTIQRQRGGAAMGGVAILRDTSTLFGALDPRSDRKPGQLQQDIPLGVRVGFGGPERHPSGAATISDIAHFHDQGAGRLPQRQIVVPPDQQTLALMVRDMQRALDRMKRR